MVNNLGQWTHSGDISGDLTSLPCQRWMRLTAGGVKGKVVVVEEESSDSQTEYSPIKLSVHTSAHAHT